MSGSFVKRAYLTAARWLSVIMCVSLLKRLD